MKLIDLIHEKILREFNPKGKWVTANSKTLKQFKDEIFKLIQTAYAPIGGHPNYNSPADISSKDAQFFQLIDVDDDPEIDAVAVSKKKPAGMKSVALGHDGSSSAKRTVISKKIKDMKKSKHYIEVSGRMYDILKAGGVPIVDDEELIKRVLKGKEIEYVGDGWYIRKIAGKKHKKIMMGHPKA